MTQNTEPMRMAKIQKAEERMRSMTEPETIEAAVQENSRNAAQNTPLSRAQPPGSPAPPICGPISSLQATACGASTRPPMMPGPFGKAK